MSKIMTHYAQPTIRTEHVKWRAQAAPFATWLGGLDMIGPYNRLITGLAIAGATAFGSMVFVIALDVVLRNMGLRPIQSTSALVEYGMMFAAMSGAPWLVRQHGHVAISSFVDAMPASLQKITRLMALVVSVAVLTLLSWRAATVGFHAAVNGVIDIRSIYIPGWVLFAMLSVGFALMALEFLRLILRGELATGSNAQH